MSTAIATSSFDSFFQTYFLDYACRGYNIYNTLAYGIIFAIAVFGAYKILKRLKLKIERKFVIGIFPFIIMGSILRVIEDSLEFKALPKLLWLCSPMIYFVIFLIALSSLLFSIAIEKALKKKQKFGYWKTWFTIGLLFDIIFLAVLLQNGIKNPLGMALIVVVAGIWALIILGFYKIRNSLKADWLTRFNAFLLSVHMFDASTTFVALQYFPYSEQHVLSNFAISLVGPIGQFMIKLPIMLLVLYFLERELPKKEDENIKNFFKVAILILGLAPGLRNFLRLGLGV